MKRIFFVIISLFSLSCSPKPPQDGTQKLYYPNGQIKSEANYRSGKLQGIFKEYYIIGKLKQSCLYEAGIKQGPCQYFSEDGTIEKEEMFQNNQIVGPVSQFYPNGKIKNRIERIVKGKMDGQFIEYFMDEKAKFKIQYQNGRFNGINQSFYSTAECESYLDTLRLNSPLKKKMESGQNEFSCDQDVVQESGNYVHGRKEGAFYEYYPNGQKRIQSQYFQGNLKGVRREYYYDGSWKQVSNYKEGLLDGVFEEYYPNEKIKRRLFYLKGQQLGQAKSYFSDGSIESEGKYRYGKLDGRSYLYSMKGKPLIEADFKNDALAGTVKEYYDNGQLMRTTTFNEDKTLQVITDYDRSGNIINEIKKKPAAPALPPDAVKK